MSVNKEIIARILTAFLAIVENDPARFDSRDVEMVKSNDWWIERFLKENTTEDKILRALVEAMDWRKSIGLNNFTEDSFKVVNEQMPDMFTPGLKDREGTPVLWLRFNKYRKLGIRDVVKNYMVFIFEQMDRITPKGGWVVLADMGNITAANIDLEMFNLNIQVIEKYYPRGEKRWIIIDVPPAMVELMKLVLSYMSENLQKTQVFITKEQVIDYFDDKNILPYIKKMV